MNPCSILKPKFTPCNRVGFLRQDLKTHFPLDAQYTNSKLSVLITPKKKKKNIALTLFAGGGDFDSWDKILYVLEFLLIFFLVQSIKEGSFF